MEKKVFKTMFGGKEITITTGQFAPAANAACTVQMGDTVVLVTAVMGSQARSGISYFPLMVDYEEKLYAAGRIKGSRFIKREGRPTDEAVLVGRFIDRALRPLFNEEMRRDVQVIVTALSFDGVHDPDILGLIGASCALHISDIPWNGPIGAIRVGGQNGSLIMNPTYEERAANDFDLDIAGTTEKVVMIEARANETDEQTLINAFEKGRKELQPIIELIENIRVEVGKEKVDLFTPKTDEEKQERARKEEVEALSLSFLRSQMEELFFSKPLATKKERSLAKAELEARLVAHLESQEVTSDEIGIGVSLVYDFVANEASRIILEEGRRLDGRGMTEVRPLGVEVGLLPRVHGVGYFGRGETQVLSVCTLGAPGDKQILDGMETVTEKRYMHHYNFLPFSVGEARPLRGAGRREIGHGALAEKALEPMLPSQEDFPYTIRVVSETMNSNGSSSMASTCGSTLALMDAGVPIKKPVAGVAIGIASRGDDQWKVITDIQDLEDGKGGMDFKVTGTRDGVTAIQMDTKTQGLTQEMIVEAFEQAKNGRNTILDQMEAVIATPKAELSAYAPRIMSLKIDPEKIGDVIGPGGKIINKIIEETGVEAIDIEQDGLVMITSKNQESGQKAYDWVHGLTRDIAIGEQFDAKIVRIMDFGAIAELEHGKDGMVHVSALAPWRVGKVEDIVKMGDTVKVKVIAKEGDRMSLSMKQADGNVYTEEMKAKAQKQSPRPAGKKPAPKPFRKPRSSEK